MDKVRIAVAGAGSIGVRHIKEIQRSQGAILSAIIDPSPKAIEVGRREDAPVYRSLPEYLARHRPDGVVLATPNQMHVEQGLQCIAAGVPVLIEKPIAHTLEDGARLVQAAERANAKLLVGHHRRHSRILHKAVEIVQSGVLGQLVAVIGCAAFYKSTATTMLPSPGAKSRAAARSCSI
jgi:predicted dehydrogenase